MASRNDYSKFNSLPERQSKIDTIMKQEEHGLEEQLYCICRSSDIARFMIGCDKCEEWFHGDCIDIGEEESRYIKRFYCPRCRKKDPTLEICYKQSKLDKVAAAKERDKQKRLDKEDEKSKRVREKERDREKLKERERQKEKERQKERDKERQREREKLKERDRQQKEREKEREKDEARRAALAKKEEPPSSVLREVNYSDDDVWEPPEKQSKSVKPRKKEPSTSKDYKRRRKDSDGSDDQAENGPQQCYGPGCTKPARNKSKYCSDNCGLNLATARMYQILPARIQEWNMTACIAEDKNKKSLEQIRRQQMAAKAALEEMDRKHKELDILISRARTAVPVDDDDEEGDGEGDAAATYCITCGLDIPLRNALRHMEKCFNKYESQTSFGSVYKTHIEGNNMFCDFFNPATRMYCKRLRVLCPEHSKEPKISEHEVCGCPLLKNVLEKSNEFCRIPKKKCGKHLGWEKLRRAEIDMERVRQWLKIDDLFEKERQVRQAMASRAGVLSLMLHSTYNHTLMDPQPEPEKVEKVSERVKAAAPHADHDYF